MTDGAQRLIGKQCDSFEDRYLKVGVSLNKEPGVSNGTDEEPVLVKLKSTDECKWYVENIVFLYEDSNISFTLESEGPCGYGFKIFTMERNIIKKLYAGNEGSEERITAQVSRYQNSASSIRVKNFHYFLEDQYNNIENNILERSLVSIITWPIFGYERGSLKYRPGTPPVYVNQKSRPIKNQNFTEDVQHQDLSKYVKNQGLSKYVKNIYSIPDSIKKSKNVSSKAVESPINDSNCIVQGPNSRESFNERITNILEDKNTSDLKTNGSVQMLLFTLEKDEKVEDVCELIKENSDISLGC